MRRQTAQCDEDEAIRHWRQLQDERAGAKQHEQRRRGEFFKCAEVRLPPEESRPFAGKRDVAGHQPGESLVGIELAERADQNQKA